MKTTYSLGEAVEMGVDEAGRGCFWGPLYAGAVIWPAEDEWTDKQRELAPKVNDSKKISEKKRDLIAKEIGEALTYCGIGRVDASEIDEHGMTWANQEAFRRAMRNCYVDKLPDLLLIDGILGLPKEDGVKYQCIAGGDGLYLPIAAASILAKTHRDEYMEKLALKFPAYHWQQNKGYGTLKHRDAIRLHGANVHHRMSFALLPRQLELL